MLKYLLLLPPCLTQVVGIYVIKQWLLKIDSTKPLLQGIYLAGLNYPVNLLSGILLYGVSFFLLLAAVVKVPMTSFFPVFLGTYIIVGVLFGVLVGDGRVNTVHIFGVILILSGIVIIANTQ